MVSSNLYGLEFNWIDFKKNMISYFSDLPCLVYKFGMQQVDLFDVITWSLWNRRNKNRLNEACVLLNRVFDSAKSYLKEFQHHRVPPMKK